MYLEATNRNPDDVTRLISPNLPFFGTPKCLRFSYNVFGMHIGMLRILDQNGQVLWEHVGVKEISKLYSIHTIVAKFPKIVAKLQKKNKK